MDSGVIAGILVAILIVIVILAAFPGQAVNIVQQGQVGVVKRLGEYRRTHEPGWSSSPRSSTRCSASTCGRSPCPGDRQDVITKDNVVVTVNATIFTQVVDAKQALFSVKNFDIAIDALARTALRSVIGTMTLDEALSERERINTDVQQQMEVVTDKWGIRISRIEIVEIAPPPQILQALALQKQADQEKRAKILQSEGRSSRPSTWPRARRRRRSEPPRASARPPSCGPRATARPPSSRPRAGPRPSPTVYGAIKKADPDPTLVAILQLDTLGKFADSDNAKIVVPFESAALMGAAQALAQRARRDAGTDTATGGVAADRQPRADSVSPAMAARAALAALRRRSSRAGAARGWSSGASRSRAKGRAFRDETYWGRPVPGFGDPEARLLVVGPGAGRARRQPHRPRLHRRRSGDLLCGALLHAPGFADRPASVAPDDGLTLTAPTSRRPSAAPRPPTSRRPRSATAARRSSPASSRLLDRGARRSSRSARSAGTRRFRRRWRRRPRRRAAAAVRARRRGGHRAGTAPRLLPPEPAEHLHRPADARRCSRRSSRARATEAGRSTSPPIGGTDGARLS